METENDKIYSFQVAKHIYNVQKTSDNYYNHNLAYKSANSSFFFFIIIFKINWITKSTNSYLKVHMPQIRIKIIYLGLHTDRLTNSRNTGSNNQL